MSFKKFSFYICLFLSLLFSTNSFAVDPAIVEANNQFYDILKQVEIVKNANMADLERERAFTNFANEFGEPGANWQTLKIKVLEIIIADAAFWAKQITRFPAIQEKLIRDFEMDWYDDSTSNYSEKLVLAKIELLKHLEEIEKQKVMLIELKQKLSNTRATVLK